MVYTAAIFAFTVLIKYARVDKKCTVVLFIASFWNYDRMFIWASMSYAVEN